MDSGTSKKPKISSTYTDDQSFLETLKTDWKLFWHGMLGDEIIENEDSIDLKKLEALTLDQIKKITKTLSQDRKKINQRIEEINHKIESQSEKLDSLKLVSGSTDSLDETVDQINKLHDIGLQLTNQLTKLNTQLREFRIREDFLKTQVTDKISDKKQKTE